MGAPASGVPERGVSALVVPEQVEPERGVRERVVPDPAEGQASELGAVPARELEQGLAARGFAART